MRIAAVGMGRVGSVLGSRWAQVGHTVAFGVRDPGNAEKQAKARAVGASLASVHHAASDAEVILLAVPWKAVPDALKAAGDLAGKVLLDCTNPLTHDYFGLAIGTNDSAGEQVAKLVPRATAVKIFNTNAVANMANPDYGTSRVMMLRAGDDTNANAVAAGLATDLGFDAIQLGPLAASRPLEPLAVAWIVLLRQQGVGVDFALNVVRRP